jgi:YD repeat-containing protein
MVENLPTQPSKRVADFLERAKASHRGRLIFVIDATGSRQPTWDAASRLQAQMFDEAARLGTLDVQLVYFRGLAGFGGECKVSRWTGDGREMARLMARVTCQTGHTQIGRALEHARKEHQVQPISAIVYVGDMCEESAQGLYDATAGLNGVPCFLFQEGDDQHAALIFKEMARLSHGAYSQFRAGAERELAELLRAVAAFAAGGLTALSDLRSEAAVKLLGQMKK